jgi:hypothetical protein
VPWKYAFWGTLVVGFALVTTALAYPALAQTTLSTQDANQHLWPLAQTVVGVWLGLLAGKEITQ